MGNQHDIMTVEEARERYDGDWLALEVVSRDENEFPNTVRLVEMAPTRPQLSERVRGKYGLYITYAGPLVPEGHGYLLSSARRAGEGVGR